MSPSSPTGPSSEPTRVKAGRRPRQQLTARQNKALEQLIAGSSIRQTAEALGLDRRTVQRWLNENPRFRAAYNAWQQEQIDSSRAQLLTVLGDAVAAVSKSVKEGDARIAMGLLKQFKVMPPPAAAPSDPEILRHAVEIERQEQMQDLDVRARKLGREDLSPRADEEDDDAIISREEVDELRAMANEMESVLDKREGKPRRIYGYTPPVCTDTNAIPSNPPPPGGAAPDPPSPPARRPPRPTDEPEPLDPTGPVVAYNDPNTFILEEP